MPRISLILLFTITTIIFDSIMFFDVTLLIKEEHLSFDMFCMSLILLFTITTIIFDSIMFFDVTLRESNCQFCVYNAVNCAETTI